jgi:hypothetical protein
MERAVVVGREVMIHIPMQPENSDNAIEPNTITTTMSDFEIRNQIETWMYELHLAVGANNHMGSKATQDSRVLNVIMSAIRQNDMFFIDSVTSSNSRVEQVARRHGVLTNSRDIFLDIPDTTTRGARRKIEQIKRMNDYDAIIIITHCHSDNHYRQLAYFIQRLKYEGYELVPPSMVVH